MADLISRFSEETDRLAAREKIREIFFLTSPLGDNFKKQDRECFFHTWAGWYLDSLPGETLLARNAECKIVGYLAGCLDSNAAFPLYRHIFYFKAFEHWYVEYPAHFHVNCHPDFQGYGFGASLVQAFIAYATKKGRIGVHLVTGEKACNRSFYERLQFCEKACLTIHDQRLVILARDCRVG